MILHEKGKTRIDQEEQGEKEVEEKEEEKEVEKPAVPQ